MAGLEYVLDLSDASQLKSERNTVAQYIDTQIQRANTLIDGVQGSLDSALAELSDAVTERLPYMQDQSISLSSPTILDTTVPPAAPTLSLTVPEFTAVRQVVSVPAMGVLGAIPTFVDPALDLTWSWSEAAYVSSLLDSLRDKMAVDLVGGTGLNAGVEAAIYARARSRMEFEYTAEYDQITAFFASRGLSNPTGVMESRIRGLNTKYARLYADLDRDVMVKQAELEMENRKFVEQLTLELEKTLLAYHGSVQQRALEAESSRIGAMVAIYNSKATVYNTLVSAYKVVAEIELAKVESAVKQLEMSSRAYEADVNAYVAQVQANVSLVKGEADIYQAVIGGYAARANVVKSANDTAIALFEAQVSVQAQNIQIDMKKADIVLSGMLQQMQLKVEAIKAQASISAEIIAAALNSTNTGATMNFSAGVQESYAEGKSVSESAQHIITEVPAT